MTSTRLVLVGVATLSLVLAACGGDDGDTTTSGGATGTTAEATTTAGVTTTATAVTSTTAASTTQATSTTTEVPAAGQAVYFLLDELDTEDGTPGPYLVPVFRETAATGDPAENVMTLLLEGPTTDETSGIPAMSTAIPSGTSLLGVTIEAGVATVDLSGEFDDGGGSLSMFGRLAQVVYTLTRLPDVDEVTFSIDGTPVTTFSGEGIELDGPQGRADYYDLLPPVFVDSPSWGEPVTSPIAVSGLSNVFEATSQVMLTDDDGAPLFEDFVTATCGTGCWGDWSIEIPYSVDREQFGALIVWEISAQDGSRVNIREYPVLLR
jgi:spore germination protein GerM